MPGIGSLICEIAVKMSINSRKKKEEKIVSITNARAGDDNIEYGKGERVYSIHVNIMLS